MSSREISPFLQGNYAPWRVEGDAPDLEVTGELPRDLNGTFYRNGPNPAFAPAGRYHWFDGDGMIHAITLREGRASYRNRWVQSAGLRDERAAGRALATSLLDLTPTEAPRFKNAANTNIVFHAGKLLALVESSLPTQLVPCTLETLGEWDFGGALGGPMTAHPKMDPKTGEMLFFGYSPFPPYLVYHVCDASGALVRSEPIDLPWPSMIHDFAITDDAVVFMLFPLVFSFENIKERGGAFSWEPERGTRITLVDRRTGERGASWRAEAGFCFHHVNAYELGDEVIVDVCRFPDASIVDDLYLSNLRREGASAAGAVARSYLHRYRLRPGSADAVEQRLGDEPLELPRINYKAASERPYGYAWGVGICDGSPWLDQIVKVDVDSGEARVWRELHCFPGEPVFVARPGAAAEDDGVLLSIVLDGLRERSMLLVLDAANLAELARAEVSHPIPYGFHGQFVRD